MKITLHTTYDIYETLSDVRPPKFIRTSVGKDESGAYVDRIALLARRELFVLLQEKLGITDFYIDVRKELPQEIVALTLESAACAFGALFSER